MELDIVFGCVYDLENLFFFFKFFKIQVVGFVMQWKYYVEVQNG